MVLSLVSGCSHLECKIILYCTHLNACIQYANIKWTLFFFFITVKITHFSYDGLCSHIDFS